MTIQEIETIVTRKERETIKVELKSFEKLFDKKGADDVAFGIIAFANSFGGKIIFGVTNDGKFEGKFKGNIDEVKSNFYNLTRDRISPNLDLQISLVETDKWDVIVIEVPKRKGMPHAVVNDRKSHEIKSRTYYKRTSHGKKLVSDGELERMFSSVDEPEQIYEFRLFADFNRQFHLVHPANFGVRDNFAINNILNLIGGKRVEELFTDTDTFKKLMLEIYPYLFLKTFLTYYKHSWHIHISDGFDRSSSGPITDGEFGKTPIKLSEIVGEGFEILNSDLNGFKEFLISFGVAGIDTFQLPEGSTLKLSHQPENYSEIVISNSHFSAEIVFSPLSWGGGINQRNPFFEDNIENPEAYNYFLQNFYHFDCHGYLKFVINYDLVSYEEYLRLSHYYETMCELIKRNWDINPLIKKLPPKETRIMANNVSEILNILKTPEGNNPN